MGFRVSQNETMLRIRMFTAPTLALVTIALLSSCVSQQEGFADLDGAREAIDKLPQLEDYAYDVVDSSSSRYVGEHNGTSLWLAGGLDGYEVCLVAYATGDAWGVSCGGGTGMRSGGAAGSFEVVPNGGAAPAGATQVSENVYAD